MTRYLLTVLALAVGLLASEARGALIANGTFETGTFTGWTLTGTGFFIDTDQPSEGKYFAHAVFVAQEGGGGQSTITQTFTAPANLLDISVDMGWVGVPGLRSAILKCPSLGTQVDLFAGTELSLPNAWKRYTSGVAAMSGRNVEIDFFASGTETNGMNFYVDNIQFTQATPEPGTMAILATGGLSLLGGWRRRRRP
ncbi:MAG: PEP-CTERM sorting domain-containing protein [Planctomycetota bacterium]|nr:PEP-CTERM sorting domain-containing protein [Planctomycetota bacterium]